MRKRIMALLLTMGFSLSTLAGCSNKTPQTSDVDTVTAETTENKDTVESTVADDTRQQSEATNVNNVSANDETSTTIKGTEAPTKTVEQKESATLEEQAEETGTEPAVSSKEEMQIVVETLKTTETVVPQADDDMTSTQRNSLTMLNFLTVLTQEINDSKGSRLFVENAYSSLINNTYPNAVDSRTQAQLTNILDTLEGYRMVDVKRERLEYIYEQNRAQAMRQAIPSPMSVLNIVQSKSLLKAAVSVVYMAVDSYKSYTSYTAETDLQYLQDGWELDDEESAELHNSRKQAFTYMLSMVRDNDLPGDLTLNENSVQEFVSWKNNTNVVRRVSWLESNEDTYKEFGTYWLTLAESYFELEEYEKCLDAVSTYEKVTSRIFRKDYDYAKILPMAIVSAKEVYGKTEYTEIADKYAKLILNNTDNSDWTLTYFVAEVYLDLYGQTKNESYIENAYDIAYDNVNYLVDEQKELNTVYLADVNKAKVPKSATKREKEEIKQYNKTVKAERKVELPPVSEALYLNCDLLFALANEMNIDSKEQKKIDSILHENGESIFLMTAIDNRFRFDSADVIKTEAIDVEYDGDEFVIPATFMSSNSCISVTVSNGSTKTVIDDWTVKEVTRKKNTSYTDYTATFTSETAKKFKFKDGMTVMITVTPVAEDLDETLVFIFDVVGAKKPFVINSVKFNRR